MNQADVQPDDSARPTNTVADVRGWAEHYRALPWSRPGFEWSDAEQLRGNVISAFLLESGVTVLLAALERKDAALRAVEWCDRVTIHSFPEGEFPEPACPCCRHAQRFGHDQGCALAAALSKEA